MSSTPKAVRDYLAAIGAAGGASTSAAKRASSAANGKKGGRPKGAKDSKPRVRRSPANKSN
jgi:hypothetical protein